MHQRIIIWFDSSLDSAQFLVRGNKCNRKWSWHRTGLFVVKQCMLLKISWKMRQEMLSCCFYPNSSEKQMTICLCHERIRSEAFVRWTKLCQQTIVKLFLESLTCFSFADEQFAMTFHDADNKINYCISLVSSDIWRQCRKTKRKTAPIIRRYAVS